MRMRIRDLGIFLSLDVESGMEKIRIRDKHPGSATLYKNSIFFYTGAFVIFFVVDK
jgi:hypothetical protein